MNKSLPIAMILSLILMAIFYTRSASAEPVGFGNDILVYDTNRDGVSNVQEIMAGQDYFLVTPLNPFQKTNDKEIFTDQYGSKYVALRNLSQFQRIDTNRDNTITAQEANNSGVKVAQFVTPGKIKTNTLQQMKIASLELSGHPTAQLAAKTDDGKTNTFKKIRLPELAL